MKMSSKLVVVIEVDVMDVESHAEAREAAFEMARPLLLASKKRGPKAAGPRAVVTGVRVSEPEEDRALPMMTFVGSDVDETVTSDTVRG